MLYNQNIFNRVMVSSCLFFQYGGKFKGIFVDFISYNYNRYNILLLLISTLISLPSVSIAGTMHCVTKDGTSVSSNWNDFPQSLEIDGVAMKLVNEDSQGQGKHVYLYSIIDIYLMTTITYDGIVYNVSIPGAYSDAFYICEK